MTDFSENEWDCPVSYSGRTEEMKERVRQAGGRLNPFVEGLNAITGDGRIDATLTIRAQSETKAMEKISKIVNACGLRVGLP